MNKASIFVLCYAAFLTAVYHLVFAERPVFIPFAILILLILIGTHVALFLARHPMNPWAFFFLAPLLLATGAKVMYSSVTIQVLGTAVAVTSLMLYAYWISAPRQPFAQVKSLWPFSFFMETLWPFRSLPTLFSGLKTGKRGVQVLMGILVAFPLLIVIGALFVSADPLFSKTLADLFRGLNVADLPQYVIRDTIVGLIFLGSGWTIYTRALHKRQPEHRGAPHDPGTVVVATVLGLLNTLFLIFLGFQVAYFFGGEAFIREQGLTYAEYARNGFFQLILVAGLVFAISWVVYHATELRHRVTRALIMALIIQTGVIIVSAVMRLSLYIDAYGLTVSRWWAMASVGIIAAVLLSMLVASVIAMRFEQLAKWIGLGVLLVMGLLMTVNVECMVVRFNAERFLSGKTKMLDVDYFMRLSSDALPELVALSKANWPTEPTENPEGTPGSPYVKGSQRNLRDGVRKKAEEIRTQIDEDWRNFTVSDVFAMSAAASLQ